MPAEWEPHIATWLSWPRREGISFPDSFDRVMPALRAMVAALIESEQVCINVCNDAHEAEARQVLQGLPMERISFHMIPTNEPWCRDHGPIFLTRDEGWSRLAPEPMHTVRREGAPAPLAIVDWDYNAWGNKYPPFDLDEIVPTRVAEMLKLPVFYPRHDLGRRLYRCERRGRVAYHRIVSTKPKSQSASEPRPKSNSGLRDYLGVREIFWLGDGIAGDDTDGHIDDLARFVSEHTVVTVVEEDRADANYKPLQENLARLREMKIDNREIDIITLADAKEDCARRTALARKLRQLLYRKFLRARPNVCRPGRRARIIDLAQPFSRSPRHRDRLPRIDLGTGHISLPHAAAAGSLISVATLGERLIIRPTPKAFGTATD